MALADALARIKNTLKETFHIQPFDAAPHRKKLVAKLKTAKSQIEAGRTNAPNRMWWTGNGGTGVMLELNGHVVEVGGETWNVLPKDDVLPWFDDMIAAVEAKELDAEIEAAVEGNSPRIEDARPKPSSGTVKRTRSTGSRGTGTKKAYPADHPATLDPANWATLSAGEKIKAGVAYKNKTA